MKPKTVGRATGHRPQTHPYSPPAFAAGFTTGTIILSQDGEMPVEYLSVGDRVISRDCGMVRLAGLTRHTEMVRAISFAAGSLGHTRPEQDVVLPAQQQILIRDWRAPAMHGQSQTLVRADALVDGEFIRDLGLVSMTLYQLHFDRPHVIYAGGLEADCSVTTEQLLMRPAA